MLVEVVGDPRNRRLFGICEDCEGRCSRVVSAARLPELAKIFDVIADNSAANFDHARSRGIAVLNAAPYAGGILAKGSAAMPRLTYQPASDADLEPVWRVEATCTQHGVAPGAAALRFSLRDARFASTIIGVSTPERLQQTPDWASAMSPEDAWSPLAALPFPDTDPDANREYKPG